MNTNFLFIAIIAVCIIMTIKNLFTIIRIRKDKNYVSAYTGMLKDQEDAYDNLCKYLETEKQPELISKTNIVKVYLEASKDKEVEETIKNIDFKSVVFDKKGNTRSMLEKNADVFIWLIYDLVILHSKKKYADMEKIYKLVKENEDALNSRVEYLVFVGVYNALKKDYQIDAFLKDLINGEYTGVTYDKKLIGIYKRISAMILAYRKEELDESNKDDLTIFSQTLVGKKLMQDIGIYNEYKAVEEDKPEVVEDKKEEKK